MKKIRITHQQIDQWCIKTTIFSGVSIATLYILHYFAHASSKTALIISMGAGITVCQSSLVQKINLIIHRIFRWD